MSSFKFNQMAMALLSTVFLLMGMSFLSESLFHTEAPETKGYAIEVADADAAKPVSDAPAGPAFDPVEPLLASASVENGAKVFKKCAACHVPAEGGANKVGPALWDIVNRPIAQHEGFKYSGALAGFGEGKQWTYGELNGFLWKPKTYVKGTSMGFAGIKKVEERADLIAYLRSLSNAPAPLPE